MTNDEFLNRLNLLSAALRVSPATRRMLLDWVDERLIPGPKPIGASGGRRQNWVWSELSLTRARQILIYRSAGLVRVTELAVQLWLDGRDMCPDLALNAFCVEAERDIRRMRRRMGYFSGGPTRPTRVELRGIGQADPAFTVAGLEAPDDLCVFLGRISQWGGIEDSAFSKLFGAEDEVDDAALTKLRRATLDDLIHTRAHWRMETNVLRDGAVALRRLRLKTLERAYFRAYQAITIGEGARLFLLKHLNAKLVRHA